MAKVVRKELGAHVDGMHLFADEYQHMLDEMVAPAAFVLVQNSEHVRRVPPDLPECFLKKAHFTGFWVVEKDIQQRQTGKGNTNWGGDSLDAMRAFIAAGTQPVYMGWGSMVAVSPDYMTTLAVGALKLAGKRGIIVGGWAKLNIDLLKDSELTEYAKENVFFVESAPHEWLFPQCSVTVHHGGMGTTIAGFRAGVPQIITPTIYDQFGNGETVQECGTGLTMKGFSKISHKSLAEAIEKASNNESIVNSAKVLGETLRVENGLENAAKAIRDFVRDELDTGKWAATNAQVLQRRSQPRKSLFSWWMRIYGSSPFG